MSRVCTVSGSRPSIGHKRSHAMNATRRRFNLNLMKKKVYDPKTGRMKKVKVSAATLRTLLKRSAK